MLEKYIDKNITLVLENRTIKGKLLFLDRGRYCDYQRADKGQIFAGIPKNLATKPTLSVLMDSKSAGKYDIEFDYLTGGMTWNANNAGTTYKNAKLKVVAGDIHRVTPEYGGGVKYAVLTGETAAPRVREKSSFEYHLYTIPIRTTLKNNQDKQISFLDNNAINVNKIFECDLQYSSNVMVKVKFKNSNMFLFIWVVL